MIRFGIICPSEIAFRRFLPSLKEAGNRFQFVAESIASPEEWFGDISNVPADAIEEQQSRERAKAQSLIEMYGGKVVVGYKNLITSNDIDAVYIPLPPALHFKWAKLALQTGKHVFVEKPLTTCLADTDELIRIASEKQLALHENYMFIYHNQLESINTVVRSGEIGDVRLYRITFGFPLRQLNDFRYNKGLGGGALLDVGGYCIKYANYLLGGNARIVSAQANGIDGFEVDMYGSATLINEIGDTAQIAFGMHNDYRCEIEIWGSKGTITSNRILTAPANFVPTYTIKKNQEFEIRKLPIDDAFLKSILHFEACVGDVNSRKKNYNLLHEQEKLVEDVKKYVHL